MATLANIGSDTIDSDANRDGVITVINPTKDNYSFDVGIYCECDDYLVRPDKYKSISAPALSIFGGLLVILTFSLMVVLREEV